MPERTFVIGTRGSALALRQAQTVQARLEERAPGRFRQEVIAAQADRNPDVPLIALGGEGIFVKELEAALLDRRIDLAVHSLKDLPLDAPTQLTIGAVLKRDEPRDALVSRGGEKLAVLPAGSRIGTSSLRRQSQLRRRRPDLTMVEMRGNVDTRLRKLDEGRYDAIVLAACGLIRLGMGGRITELLDLVPEPGQGALAVETRADDSETAALISALEDRATRACVEAERAFLRALGGGCRVPIAAYATARDELLELEGIVAAPDGRGEVRGRSNGPIDDPVALGERLAADLDARGARELLT